MKVTLYHAFQEIHQSAPAVVNEKIPEIFYHWLADPFADLAGLGRL